MTAFDYTRLHEQILKQVEDLGSSVTFTKYATNEVYDETIDSPEPTPMVVTGKAVEVRGDPDHYRDLEVIKLEPVSLIFVPDAIGDMPSLGSVVTWAGTKRSVKSRDAIRPAGEVIGARLVIV